MVFMRALLGVFILAPVAILAAPLPLPLRVPRDNFPHSRVVRDGSKNLASTSSCKIPSKAAPDFPEGQANLTIPEGQAIWGAVLGRGVQNYTCTGGAYVSTGALANLFDTSCIAKSDASLLPKLPSMALASMSFTELTSLSSKGKTVPPPGAKVRAGPINLIGHHYFVNVVLPTSSTNTTTDATAVATLSPKFDLTPAKSKTSPPADYATFSKHSSLTSPVNSTSNVPWLQLTAVEGGGMGTLAKTIFRVDTAGGQPPATCSSEGEQLSIQYAANYWILR